MNKFRNEATATAIKNFLESNAKLKKAMQGSCNVKIDNVSNNHVIDLFSSVLVDRVEIWLDCNSIVLFIGGNAKKSTNSTKEFETLFNDSIYAKYSDKYNAEKQNTKHKFSSLETACNMLVCLTDRVEVEQKSEKQTTKAKQTTKKREKVSKIA